MTDFVRFVFSVGGLVFFGAAATLWLSFGTRSKIARRLLVAVAMFYLLASTYVTSAAASRLLASGFEPFVATEPAGRTAIVVMGSGSYTIRDWDGTEYSSTDAFAASRVLEAVRVYRLVRADWVITSGGKVEPDQRAVSTGQAMRELLLQLGVPAERVLTETTSRNTHEESVAIAAMLPKMNVERVVIVTSDFHMRRTLGTFRAAGIHAVPAIARDPFPPQTWKDWLLPGQDGLWRAGLVAHELIGIGYYAARRWYRF